MAVRLPPQPHKKPAPSATTGVKPMGQDINKRPKSKDWVSAKGIRYDLGGYQMYFFQVAMGDTSFSGLSLMAHTQLFDQKQLETMLADAAALTLKTRIEPRRKSLSLGQEPIGNPMKLNEESFRADKEFLESIMIDKYGFEQVMPAMCRATLEPTVKGVSHAAA